MKEFLKEKDIDFFLRQHRDSYDIIIHHWSGGIVLEAINKAHGDIYLCAEKLGDNWLWKHKPNFIWPKEVTILPTPEFDLNDMELAEIIIDEYNSQQRT